MNDSTNHSMLVTVDRIQGLLEESLRANARGGWIHDEVFQCAWHLGSYRIRGKVRDEVLWFQALSLAGPYRRQGIMSSLFRRLGARNRLGDRAYRYLVGENCNETCLGMFRAAGFHVDDPVWLRLAWLEVEQLALPFPAPHRKVA